MHLERATLRTSKILVTFYLPICVLHWGCLFHYSSLNTKCSLHTQVSVYDVFHNKIKLWEQLVMYLQVKMSFPAKYCHNSAIPLKYSNNIIQSFNLYASWIIIMTYMQMQLRVLIYANNCNFQLYKYFSNSITRVAFFRKWLPTASYWNLLWFKIFLSYIFWDGKDIQVLLEPFLYPATVITAKPGGMVRKI